MLDLAGGHTITGTTPERGSICSGPECGGPTLQWWVINAVTAPVAEANCGSKISDAIGHIKTSKKF
jgi:hypothetical protein